MALLDDEVVAAHSDLDPEAAGLAETTQAGELVSIRERVDHVATAGLVADVSAG